MDKIEELRIRVYGDPVLRQKAEQVKVVTDRHRKILSKMAQLMYDGEGIGLAAPQAGIKESMIVVDIGKGGLYKLINPRVVKVRGAQKNQEGCLSVPGVCIKIKRANKITVKAMDNEGKPLTIEAEGLLACVFQHEIDHLKGKLIIDYASFIEKIKMKSVLESLKAKARENEESASLKACKLQL
jgi:peptide deformylase